MAGCGCGGFKSMNGLGASPDGLGQYNINRAGHFGDVPWLTPDPVTITNPTAMAGAAAAACGLSGVVYGAIIGAAIGYINKQQLGKGALWGALIGGVGYSTLCAATAYSAGSAMNDAAQSAVQKAADAANNFPGNVPVPPSLPNPMNWPVPVPGSVPSIPGMSGIGAYYAV